MKREDSRGLSLGEASVQTPALRGEARYRETT